MTDTTRFEARLADALGRYADRVPVNVDVEPLVRFVVSDSAGTQPRRATGDRRLVLALVVVAAVTLAGVALLGGRFLAPVPPVVVSPSASTSGVTATPEPTASATPAPTASPAPTPVAVLSWTEQDIGTQPAVTSIWRVGEWFIAVGPESSFADDDRQVDAAFIRSRDGQTWESIPAPARGMEVETGAVDGDTLWIVGRLGTSADPKRGIWTTRDGMTWERVANVHGLDFGPGRVDAISRANAGWLAIARQWINPEAQDGFMFKSTDGVEWTKMPLPEFEVPYYGIDALVSDGDQWLMVTGPALETATEVWALTSSNGTDWTQTRVAELARGPAPPAMIGADGAAFGRGGFVIVGQQLAGEFPHPVAWVSTDGVTWTDARMDGLPDPAGETGLDHVVAFDGGYFASGYRLDDDPSFWTSIDGTSWAEVDDLFGSDPAYVRAIAASRTTYVAGGQTSNGGAFTWAARH